MGRFSGQYVPRLEIATSLEAVLVVFSISRANLQGTAAGCKLALLVRVNDDKYAKLHKIEFAKRNVQELKSTLEQQGYAVKLRTRELASIKPIQDELKMILGDVVRGSETTLPGFPGIARAFTGGHYLPDVTDISTGFRGAQTP